MINLELAQLYTELISLSTLDERFAKGGTANLYLFPPGLVAKQDKPGYRFVEREFRFMCQLWEKGFRAMPQPQTEFGISFAPEATLLMEEVGYGLTLEEVVMAWQDGLLNEFLLRSILDVHVSVLQAFWSQGAVHADPHLKNFIVSMDRDQNWQVWIIDFGMSFWEGFDDRAMPTTVGSIKQDREKHLFYLSEFGVEKWVDFNL